MVDFRLHHPVPIGVGVILHKADIVVTGDTIQTCRDLILKGLRKLAVKNSPENKLCVHTFV